MALVSAALTFGAFGDIVTAIDLLIKSTRLVLSSGEAQKTCRDIVSELEVVKDVTSRARVAIESGQISTDVQNVLRWHAGRSHDLISNIQREVDSYRWSYKIFGAVKWAISSQTKIMTWKTQLAEQSFAILLSLQLYESHLISQRLSKVERSEELLMEEIRKILLGLQRISPWIGYNSQNAIQLLDVLGKTILLPIELCQTWEIFDKTLKSYFSGRLGEDYVCSGDYDVSSEENEGTVIVTSLGWEKRLRRGMFLKMSVILRQMEERRDSLTDRNRNRNRRRIRGNRVSPCPRCNHSNFEVKVVDGWVECFRCDGRYQVSEAKAEQSRPSVITGTVVQPERNANHISGSMDEVKLFRSIHVIITRRVVARAIEFAKWVMEREKEREKELEKELETLRLTPGNDHLNTLLTMEKLASIYNQSRRLAEAEELSVKVLEAQKRLFGNDHHDTLRTMETLAFIYTDQDRLAEAEKLFVETLEARKQLRGLDHPDTLRTMENLASIYRDQGHLAEAEKLFVETLKAWKQLPGNDHHVTLRTMETLASFYSDQGRLAEAEKLFVETLEAWKQLLGLGRPVTLRTMETLTFIYRDQGRLAEAEKLSVETLEAWKQLLGLDHPVTLRTMEILAFIYRDQGRLAEAEKQFVETLEAWKRLLGPDCPDKLRSMETLASIYRDQGRLAEAEELSAEVLKAQKRIDDVMQRNGSF